MKKHIITFIAAILCLAANAQTQDPYLKLYENLVSRVGYDGIGVWSLLEKWSKADSCGVNLQVAKFNYHFAKSRKDSVTIHSGRKYLGMDPVLSLKDSTGNDIYYFSEPFYDEAEFNLAISDLDMALAANNDRLDLYATMADALSAYEKEKTGMTMKFLSEMIDRNYRKGNKWLLPDGEADNETFTSLMQTYCYLMYQKGSPEGYEAFKSISEKMLKYEKNNANFTNNIGSYYLVYKQDDKTALKYYKKALKINAEDEVATKNIKLIERRARAAAKK